MVNPAKIVAAVTLLSLAVLAQNESQRAVATNSSVAANYATADVIFKGFLLNLSEVPQGYKAEFDVDTPIKNLEASKVVVFSPRDSRCGRLESLKAYFVYAQNIGGQLWADPCNGTKHRSLAESDLKYIHTFNEKVLPECSDERVRKLGKRAAAVVIGKVLGSPKGDFPAFWSGLVRSTEDVTYQLEKTIKGHLEQEEFVVEHMVVDNSLTADIDVPQLSPTLFKGGNDLLLFLELGTVAPDDRNEPRVTRGVDYVAIDEDCGALPADNEVRDAVSKGIQ